MRITNRQGLQIEVDVAVSPTSRGLVFVMHGLGGNMQQPHIQCYTQSFTDSGYTTVLFDTTNTFGKSDGDYANATTTNYLEDLEDVIAWSKNQSWYQEPFVLVGHSLGAFCCLLYAEAYPENVRAIVPTGSVISGKLSLESPRYKDTDEVRIWKETGWRISESETEPGRIKTLKWSHMEDRLQYDVLPKANKLTIPALLIVGENDLGTPPEHQQILFDALPGQKEMHVIPGAPHTFQDVTHLQQIREILLTWIEHLS